MAGIPGTIRECMNDGLRLLNSGKKMSSSGVALYETIIGLGLKRMKLLESSLNPSCGSDHFATYLEWIIESGSCDFSPKAESDGSDPKRLKRCKVDGLKKSQSLKSFSTFEDPEHNSDTSEEGVCIHPGSMRAMCLICAEHLPKNSLVDLGYTCKGLALADHEMNRIRVRDLKNVQCQKKLYLILDLDHTLLNSTTLQGLTQREQYMMAQANSSQDGSSCDLFILPNMHMMTKLRPLESAVLILDDTKDGSEIELSDRDTREVLRNFRKKILRGCRILFSWELLSR
ncbi:hypothetical protein MLD38_030713 [Melastoma candidum]|uniref:Uncharacterized protein n=1 Tax=Melastoma candidum TaxID=119954 RepID=A0ACB9MNP0_9MYRT|nr:hypothetical protein MLD38_030713 [Melastoma candidum]